jgi:hypothetical protein
MEFEIIRNALRTDPDAQSLWFYYQLLMTDLISNASHLSIVPSLTWERGSSGLMDSSSNSGIYSMRRKTAGGYTTL